MYSKLGQRFCINVVSHQGIFFSQIRLLFNRKNKTLRAVMTTKAIIKLLEDNRKTVQSLNPDKIMDDRNVLAIIEEILERESWKGQRASKMDLDDFLQLLSEFNEAGIHFS